MTKEEVLTTIRHRKLTENLAEMQQELLVALSCRDEHKDILIVVKDQLKYIKNCIDSIQAHTKNYNLYIWDNASLPETAEYLQSLGTPVYRSEENLGFIIPNNKLISYSSSPWVILLNSDTEVKPNWDKAMIGWLQQHPDTFQVGYAGSKLDENLRGGEVCFGYDADYIPGWAFCISRETYNQHGLFDQDNLRLAYCEDSDFSLRLKEAGKRIYALHLDLVLHYENKTILDVQKDPEVKRVFSEAFSANHDYLKRRWK